MDDEDIDLEVLNDEDVDPEWLEEFQTLGKKPGVNEDNFKVKYLGEDHAVVYKRRHIHIEQHYDHAYRFILDYVKWANS